MRISNLSKHSKESYEHLLNMLLETGNYINRVILLTSPHNPKTVKSSEIPKEKAETLQIIIFGYSGNHSKNHLEQPSNLKAKKTLQLSDIEAKVSGVNDFKAIIQHVNPAKIIKDGPTADEKLLGHFTHYQGIELDYPTIMEDSKYVEEILRLNGFKKSEGKWWIKSFV